MPKILDLTGERFGRLVVVEKQQRKNTRYLCQCDCGQQILTRGDLLQKGQKQSCGCLRKEQNSIKREQAIQSLIGQRFGDLIVLEVAEPKIYNNQAFPQWKCQSDTGQIILATLSQLKYHQYRKSQNKIWKLEDYVTDEQIAIAEPNGISRNLLYIRLRQKKMTVEDAIALPKHQGKRNQLPNLGKSYSCRLPQDYEQRMIEIVEKSDLTYSDFIAKAVISYLNQ